MIDAALKYIVGEIVTLPALSSGDVSLKGVDALKPDRATVLGVGVSLANVQEEAALRNTDHVVRNGTTTEYLEPAVHLNLSVLIWFDFQQYETALKHLSAVVELFQHKRFCSVSNESPANPFPPELDRLLFELHSIGFEQLSYLWGVAGGVYLPSVLYRVRLVRLQRQLRTNARPVKTIAVETGVV